MSTKALVVAIVGTVCVSAAAAGGFVAVRLNSADRQLADAGAPNAPAVTAPAQPSSTQAPDPASTPAPSVTPAPDPTPATPVAAPPATNPKTAPAAGHTAAPSKPAAPVVTSVQPTPAMPPSVIDPPLPVTTPPASTTPPDGSGQTADAPVDPKPVFDEVTVKENSVLGVSLDNTVSSATARVEDRIAGHVTRDLMVDGRIAIPANSRLEGVVTLVERGGKFKDQARIGVRFTTLYLPDNTKVSIQTEQIFRDGEAPGNSATSKVGTGTVLGAILGAVIGGKKGAAVGAAGGAGAGAAAVAASHTNDATMPSGVPMTVRVTAPVVVTIARIPQDQ